MPDYIPKGVPAGPQEHASNGQRIDPELVGSSAIGEIPIEHQDIHVETKYLVAKS